MLLDLNIFVKSKQALLPVFKINDLNSADETILMLEVAKI